MNDSSIHVFITLDTQTDPLAVSVLVLITLFWKFALDATDQVHRQRGIDLGWRGMRYKNALCVSVCVCE
jgi:hypothetical protein